MTALQRLMHTLEQAHITAPLNLVISCDSGSAANVVQFAKEYNWKYGQYEVLVQEQQLGVDAHNLACMRLAKELGNVVILEDDLTVAPHFQQYLDSMEVLANDESGIAGISLYRYPMVEKNRFPFELIPNNEFLYYQQRPSSKGCFYTWDMLEPYFVFLDNFQNDFGKYHLPTNVRLWGDEVWEKSFYCYLQSAKKYLAFPRFSLSTDFADVGVHMKKQTTKYAHQSALYLGTEFEMPKSLTDTDNVYDAFYELSPTVLVKYCKELSSYDFELDIYGDKSLDKCQKMYLISSKECKNRILGWDRRLKPEINNVLLNLVGDQYALGKKDDFRPEIPRSLKEDFLYYYPDTKLSDLIWMKINEVLSRFFRPT